MDIEVILRYENENIQVHHLKSMDQIKRAIPGLIEFETEEDPGTGSGDRKEKRTVIYAGGVYTVSFKS